MQIVARFVPVDGMAVEVQAGRKLLDDLGELRVREIVGATLPEQLLTQHPRLRRRPLDVPQRQRMHPPSEQRKGLHHGLFGGEPDVLLRQIDVGGHVLDADSQQLARSLRVRWIERVRHRGIGGAQHAHPVHDDVVRPEGRQGGRAEGSMRDQDRELGAVLADERDETPGHHTVTAVRMEEQIDPGLLPGRGDGVQMAVDDRDGVHGHRCLEVGAGRGQVGDDRGASACLLQGAEQPEPLATPRARHPSEPHSHSMVPGGLLVTS